MVKYHFFTDINNKCFFLQKNEEKTVKFAFISFLLRNEINFFLIKYHFFSDKFKMMKIEEKLKKKSYFL
jgi:hypothetical protein